jgi:ubiquitin fusion degradation protein 1
MMNTLLLSEGSLLNLKSTTLPLAKFIKIQPQSVNFLSIHDPKAVLEMSLRNFSALTKGDIIQISYNSQIYEIAVLEVKAHDGGDERNAVCVVETDIEVDFAPPVGYVEPAVDKTTVSSATSSRPASRMTGTGTPGHPNDVVSVHGGMAAKLDYHALSLPVDTSSESAFSKGGQTLRGKQSFSSPLASLSYSQGDPVTNVPPSTISSVRTTKSFLHGGPVPRPFKVGFGVFFVGYPVVPVKKEGGEDQETNENFKGTGVRLKDATKTKKKGKKDKDKDKRNSENSPRDAFQFD